MNSRTVQRELYRMLSDIASDYYPTRMKISEPTSSNDIPQPQVKYTPITEVASWGSFRDLGAYNRPNYTLYYLNCSLNEYNEYYRQFVRFKNGYSDKISCFNVSSTCCNYSKTLVQDNLEFFLDYMKNSYLMSNHFSSNNSFSDKYVKNSTLWQKYNFTYSNSKHLTDVTSNEMILFCDFVSDLRCIATSGFSLTVIAVNISSEKAIRPIKI